jgi:radical SAM superfamily enzyme YgiQ (UPF0313 family)
MKKRALLINPPIYDVQYWAEWSQPHGLLKIGKYLREKGYETYLIDCLFSDDKRLVNKKSKSVVNLCSSETEIPYSDFQKNQRKLKTFQRFKFTFGIGTDELEEKFLALANMKKAGAGLNGKDSVWMSSLFEEDKFIPDEIWITSIMTYWWESTVDVTELCKKIFPNARIRIGGIYPTLASGHLQKKLTVKGYNFGIELGCNLSLEDNRDLIVVGEIPEASWQDLDFDLYFQPNNRNSQYYHGPPIDSPNYQNGIDDKKNYGPRYAILTTTRGCPFNCAYCAQHQYNLYDNPDVKNKIWTDGNGIRKAVRTRGSEIVLEEIRDKFHNYGIRNFAFYEDNFLIEKDHFVSILEGIIKDKDLRGNLHLHAPEGIEIRLIDSGLAKLMFDAGFERVYLPLENINSEVVKSWNRSHSNVKMFEKAVENYLAAGFILRNMQINAFLLFGTPGENLGDVVDSIIFTSSRIGSVIPMLFTPVPSSLIFTEYSDYLFGEMKFDYHQLNGKLFPFFEFNRRIHPDLTLQDYLDLEALMFRLNAQAIKGTFDIGGKSKVSEAFRRILISH